MGILPLPKGIASLMPASGISLLHSHETEQLLYEPNSQYCTYMCHQPIHEVRILKCIERNDYIIKVSFIEAKEETETIAKKNWYCQDSDKIQKRAYDNWPPAADCTWANLCLALSNTSPTLKKRHSPSLIFIPQLLAVGSENPCLWVFTGHLWDLKFHIHSGPIMLIFWGHP